MKSLIKTLLKVAVAAGLIAYMVHSGRLDFAELEVLLQDPRVGLAALGVYGVSYCLIGSLRWHLLMRGAGLDIAYPRTLQLHMIGLFFNTVMPGSVGGDMVKAFYVMRENPERKSVAVMVIFLDRILGLVSLMTLGLGAFAFSAEDVWSVEPLRPVVWVLVGAMVVIGFGLIWAFLPRKGADSVGDKLAQSNWPGAGTLKTLYEALALYRKSPAPILVAILLGLFIQIGSIANFAIVATAINGTVPEIGRLATILPIGIFLASVPIAPAGIGVGHMAFDSLFRIAGLASGANVFNVVLLCQLGLSLLGIVPYAMFRSRGVTPRP